jgi:hypothetical protein
MKDILMKRDTETENTRNGVKRDEEKKGLLRITSFGFSSERREIIE